MMVDTFSRNQNIGTTASFAAGMMNTAPTSTSASAHSTSTFRCIESFSFLTSVKVMAPEPTNSTTGNTTFRGTASQVTLGKGRSQPPQKSVTATEETTKMLAYSARKYRHQRNPLYSVWKPPTSSDSASGKSNGARLVSAVAAII